MCQWSSPYLNDGIGEIRLQTRGPEAEGRLFDIHSIHCPSLQDL